jgi:hypothetical protein
MTKYTLSPVNENILNSACAITMKFVYWSLVDMLMLL